MCDKAILENGRTFASVPDCYKNQEMCIPSYNKMCDKAVNTHACS